MPLAPQRITILGSTGTIGVNTLDVIGRHASAFEVVALTAHSQIDRLFEQCCRFRPRFAVLQEPDAAHSLANKLSQARVPTEVLYGIDNMERVASISEVDSVMAAIVGAAGLRPTLAAALAGKRILLANKETLVMGGELFMRAVRQGGAQILPIDSEHNAIFQALPHDYAGDLAAAGIDRILLTASGGPFRKLPLDQLAEVTPEQACAHPNWIMGRKISVDSASMMNKGLEVIEAHWLFNAPPEKIEVVIHPQSVIHSLVSYVDGSVLAQLGNPDMRTPIAFALGFPLRIDAGVAPLDLFKVGALNFEMPDLKRFPCLGLAYEALTAGGVAPAVLNAANEVAVDAFLSRRLRFDRISSLVASVLSAIPNHVAADVGELLEIDQRSRKIANEWLE